MKKPNVLSISVIYSDEISPEHEEYFELELSELFTYLYAMPGIDVMENPTVSGVNIVLLEHYTEVFAEEVIELSESGATIWAFIPRGKKAMGIIADFINNRSRNQRIYPYDDICDIVRMVERAVYDFDSARHKIIQIIAHHARLIQLPKGKPAR